MTSSLSRRRKKTQEKEERQAKRRRGSSTTTITSTSSSSRDSITFPEGSRAARLPPHMQAQLKRVAAFFTRSRSYSSDSEDGETTVEDSFLDLDDGSTESHEARKVALQVYDSIVSLSSFDERKRIHVCSGIVIGWDGGVGLILTSASLLRSPRDDHPMRSDFKVKVCLPNGKISDGSICHVDWHHNIAVVKTKSKLSLEVAILHDDIVKEGDVLSLGRDYDDSSLMAARGQILYKCSGYECCELVESSCKISKSGIGGPVIDYRGHVLGINFYNEERTPFLPMVVVKRCLGHLMRFGKVIRPWLGLEVISLEMVKFHVLEEIHRKFPNTDDMYHGLFVDKVTERSPAYEAGIRRGDILISCSGAAIPSAQKFAALLLDMSEEHMKQTEETSGEIGIELLLKRREDGSTSMKTFSTGFIKERNYYRWPTPGPMYMD